MKRILSIALVLSLFGFNTAMAQRFVHPSIPFTKYDLDQLKANITKEPWLTGYNLLKNDSRSQLSYTMQGPFTEVGRAPNLHNDQWKSDMLAIHNLTFMWVFTGDSAYARKATDMLDLWAVTNTVWSGGEAMLDIGDYAPYFVTAADILRGTFPGWSDSNTVHVKKYFANVIWPQSWVPYPLRDNNKGALQMDIALSVAAFLDDADKWNQAIEVYRIDAGAALRCSLPNGEVGDAGRDDHWFVQAFALMWAAEVAWKQGVDLCSEYNNRLYAIGELYNKYAFVGDTMTFTPFGGYANYWTNWGIAPGSRKQHPFNNLINGAYSLRKGIATPWTQQMSATVGENSWSFLYLKSSDTSTATSLTPIVFPTTESVSQLSNIDIGNPGITGSASYTNGKWTVNGAGVSPANSVNFTFKTVKGDFSIIARIDSNYISSATAGLMVRESLDASGNNISVNLYNGSVNTKWNGNVNGYTHYPPKAPWWLKLERVGNRIFSYHSADGVNWSNHNLIMTSFASDVYVGLFTLSNNASALNTTVFSNVSITNTTPAGAPQINSSLSATATVEATFNYSITATNNPASYSAVNLPDGLSIDASTGIISGTPTTPGTTAATVNASNANGTGTAVLVITVNNSTAPVAPAGLAASVVNTVQIKLVWTASNNASSYAVKRSLSPGGPYSVIQSGITDTSFVDANPSSEVNNYYVVTASAGNLESGNSNEVFANIPPAIPSKPVVVNKNNQLDLSWDAALGAVTYKVKRSLTAGGPYTVIAQVSTTNYSDVNVTNGTGYYYVVSSMGNTLESANSLESFGVPGSNSSTWSATPASANWNNASDWVEGPVPTNPSIISFRSTTDSVLTNDITGLQISRMLFDTTASSYTVSGNSFNLNTDLVNVSSNTQTINTPITINNQVNVNAISAIKLTGIISGSGSLVKDGSGTLHMSGKNTYSGNTILNGSVAIAGNGTGTSGVPTSGPLGTGKIIMNGGTLYSGDSTGTIYNDIEVTAGKKSYLTQTVNAMNIYGRITGSGTFWEDGNDYPGINLYGDNSGFTGTFVAALRSGRNRLRFQVPESGSANAYWNLDANGVDCIGVIFKTGTLQLGALTGRGYFRNDGGGTPAISIGALNLTTNFGGTFANYFDIEKVGTGILTFTGNHTYWGTTTVKNGKFVLANNSSTGAFASPVVVQAGAFGGSGRSSASVTVGTGSGAGASLEPGNSGIGTFTTTAALTMLQDATYNLELSTGNAASDKISANGVTFNNAKLIIKDIYSGVLASGSSFVIIDNTSSTAVTGTFENLPELALVQVSGYDFRISYKGGDGNAVVLTDERTMPVTISSATEDTTLVDKPYSYTIMAIKSPNNFEATGLPQGLTVDGNTGVISGTPTVSGEFAITLKASNDTSTGTAVLHLVIKSNIVDGVIVAAGDSKDIVEWNSILNLSYRVKRSNSPEGPYTTIGETTETKYLDSSVSNGSAYYYVVAAVDSGAEYPNSKAVMASPNAAQLGYWKFDESDGTRATDSWGANHGTLATAATRDSGYVSSALKLDGTATSYAYLPTGIFSTLNDFTVSAWVNPKALSTWMRVFDFGTGTNQYLFLTVQAGVVSGMQTIRYSIKNGGSEQQVNYNYALPLNTWTHFAVTQSGNTCSLYINGKLVASNTNVTIKPSALESTNQNYIGKSQWNDPMFQGSIDEFRVYSRALGASEITNLVYEFAPPPAPTNLSVTGSNNQVSLTWTVPVGATNYNIKRATDAAGPYSTIANATTTSYADTTAENCTTYYYVVSAINKIGEGDNSSVASLAYGQKLAGILIGTSGSWGNNAATTKAAAVDSNLATFFDASTGTAWVGYDLGADDSIMITRIRYAPRSGYASRMVGGMFQGSNVADFSTATTLYTVTSAPTVGVYSQQTISNITPFRYIRYISSSSGYGNVAEVEFYGLAAKAPQITNKSNTQNLMYGAPFNYTIQASSSPGSYSAAGLPEGLNLNACTGIISGAPTETGIFPVILTVANNWGSANDTLLLNIYLPLTANIPDVYAMNPAVDTKNTLYLGYGPSSLTLNATAAGGKAPYTFKWSSGETSQEIQVQDSGVYSVVITDVNGWQATASTTIKIEDVRCGNTEDKVMICHNGKTICISSGDVQDHLNHGDHLGACDAYATSRTVAGANGQLIENSVMVYPNPVSETVTVKIDKLHPGAVIYLFNINGQMIFIDRMTDTRKIIPVKKLAAGVYYVQVQNGAEIITKKIVKQ